AGAVRVEVVLGVVVLGPVHPGAEHLGLGPGAQVGGEVSNGHLDDGALAHEPLCHFASLGGYSTRVQQGRSPHLGPPRCALGYHAPQRFFGLAFVNWIRAQMWRWKSIPRGSDPRSMI